MFFRDNADAYTSSGNSLYHVAAVRTEVLAALDRLYLTYKSRPHGEQREHWALEYGIPMALLETVAVMWDEIPAARRGDYASEVIAHIQREHTDRGANRAWVARTRIMAGAVLGDTAEIQRGADELTSTVTFFAGEGFHPDGSYIFHGRVHTGGYGASHLLTLAEMIQYLDGTVWAFTQAEVDFIVQRVFDTYEPVMWRGNLMDTFRARELVVKSDFEAGKQIIDSIARIERYANAEDSARLR
ncbi:MAG: hypothetical protein R2705_25480, partial [Ilumatobacteraceae bacterium]